MLGRYTTGPGSEGKGYRKPCSNPPATGGFETLARLEQADHPERFMAR